MPDAKPSFWSSLPGILTAIAALITAVVGFMAVLSGGGSDDTKTSAPTPLTAGASAPYSASITQPGDGDDVCITPKIKGTTTEPRGSSRLWLFVHALRSTEYYAAGRAAIKSDPGRPNTWLVKAYFTTKTPDDFNQTYELVVATVSQSDSDLLQNRKDGVPLPDLPAQSKPLDRIFVTTSRGACQAG